MGSSPCVWGQDNTKASRTLYKRIIPMRVGTSLLTARQCRLRRDHPHACGDKSTNNNRSIYTKGSSPCVWGQEKDKHGCESSRRIIPMRVGTSLPTITVPFTQKDHPHACGDKKKINTVANQAEGSSPCVWGQVTRYLHLRNGSRIIPMRVGTSLINFIIKLS